MFADWYADCWRAFDGFDKLGKPVLNLKKTNFEVYEDGVKQEIYDFSATNAPFEVALCLILPAQLATIYNLSKNPQKVLYNRFVQATKFR